MSAEDNSLQLLSDLIDLFKEFKNLARYNDIEWCVILLSSTLLQETHLTDSTGFDQLLTVRNREDGICQMKSVKKKKDASVNTENSDDVSARNNFDNISNRTNDHNSGRVRRREVCVGSV